MLIRFLNTWDVIGCGGTINQSESCVEVRRGMRRGAWRYAEGCAEVHGGMQRGVQRGVWRYMEGCAEVCRGV